MSQASTSPKSQPFADVDLCELWELDTADRHFKDDGRLTIHGRAAAEIERLRAEAGRLREALKPFAAYARRAGCVHPPLADESPAEDVLIGAGVGMIEAVTVGQCRRAAEALAGTQPACTRPV